MNSIVAEDARQVLSGNQAPRQPELDSVPVLQKADNWLRDHLNGVALLVIAAGAGLRIYISTRTYLNPDEALHYLIINQHSAWLAYKTSLSNAHPPLIYLVLYFWHRFGQSEWMLRFPSVVTGTIFCWMMFQWTKRLFNPAAGLISLVLCTFSPSMVTLSAEVRAYALLLFCMGGALYFMAGAFQETSVAKMWFFTLFLYLAVISHYSAVFFTMAAGLYALARFADSSSLRKLVLPWAIGQAGAIAIYAFLYVTHVSKLKNSIETWSVPFTTAYFHPDSGSIFTFTAINTANIFFFIFGSRYVAELLLLLFVAGISFLLIRDLSPKAGNSKSAHLGILFLLPFLAVWCAAIAGIYPFVGSRHTAFLAPFAIAGVSFSLAAITRQKLWAGLLAASILMAFSNAGEKPVEELELSKGDHSPAVMLSSIQYMNQTVRPGDHILVDYQSSLPLAFYFCGPKAPVLMQTVRGEYLEFTCHGNQVISLHNWKMIAQSFPGQFGQMARDNGLRPGDRVWVYQTGWGGTFDSELSARSPAFRCLTPKRYGGGIAILPFLVGPDLQPVVSPGSCAGMPDQRGS